ncbi:hypothetical protein ACHAWU_009092 [Discostella pseudostelligera]|uniref:RAVE complex protein Rav1 C-terminal domain-containing protein n=1 Tax=Discostella pseudostelligera TaxID=259834 RepID=A0ABD3MIC2_9STRA
MSFTASESAAPPVAAAASTTTTNNNNLQSPTNTASAAASPASHQLSSSVTSSFAANSTVTPGARGDRRSKLVRERSRSSAAFAASTITPSSSFSLSASGAGRAVTTTTTAGGAGDGVGTASALGDNNASEVHGQDVSSFMTPPTAAMVNFDANSQELLMPILFTSFCYKGVEVIFTAINDTNNGEEEGDSGGCHLLGIHARTRVPFQKCYISNVNINNGNNSGTSRYRINPMASLQNNKTTTNNTIISSNSISSSSSSNNKMEKQCTSKQTKNKAPVEIVQLTSHPTSGFIFASDNYGNIHSFYPTLSNPMKEAYGKFRWRKGNVAHCREIFGYSSSSSSSRGRALSAVVEGEKRSKDYGQEIGAAGQENIENVETPCFFRRRATRSNTTSTLASNAASPGRNNAKMMNEMEPWTKDSQPPLPTHILDGDNAGNESSSGGGGGNMSECVMICASMTERRVLIVHRDQLAIFDFSLPITSSSSSQLLSPSPTNNEAVLLWTHKLQGCLIENASLSGDGCAIAVVLRGEGVGVPYPFGVRTFVRDGEDGSGVGEESKASSSSKISTSKAGGGGGGGRPPIHRTGSGITTARKHGNKPTKRGGILYKPAQFLAHSAPVTRLAFRGYGTRTSSANHNSTIWNEEEEGNDLLLTTCSSDCSVRIFSQNSWRQLMHWNSPPKSRADWVRGISAANLGDLDSSSPTTSGGGGSGNTSKTKRSEGKEGLSTPPRPKGMDNASQHSYSSQNSHNAQHKADNASLNSDASAGINRALLSTTHPQPNAALLSPGLSLPFHSIPGTHAGAWIAELTFRNSFPALRLSRLSYLKTGGDDALPAHFESVAAILPPGSIAEEVVLEEGCGMSGCRLEVEGIWTVWDAWDPDLKGGSRGGGDLKNDQASAFNSSGEVVGIVSHPIGVMLGEGVNPTVAASAANGSDLGGSHMPPSELRLTSCHFSAEGLAQIEMPLWGDKDFGAMEFGSPMRYVMMMPEQDRDTLQHTDIPEANLEYESGSRLCARSSPDRRSINLCWRKHGAVNFEEILDYNTDDSGIRRFQDLSMSPLPLSLPSLTLPGKLQTSSAIDHHAVASLHWWPDENFGGPPRLLAVTSGGTFIVYEMPPPWSALEPPMPEYDPFNDDDDCVSRGSSVDSDNLSDVEGEISMDEGVVAESYSENLSRSSGRTEYTVSILPHPDFGLGLRLESSAIEGMPPIAGSFKKHPLSGGRLPAERCGLIALGDEFLAVNDVSVDGMTFEDAIGTVRQVGYDSYGAPLQLRFRRCHGKRRSPITGSPGSSTGRKSQGLSNDIKQGAMASSGGSLATIEVGAESEIQQGFGRIIAIVRDVLDRPNCHSRDHVRNFSLPAMLLLPWNFGKGATVSAKMYGGALLLWAVPGNRTIKAARLEAVLDIDPENARFMELGSISLDEGKGSLTHPEIKSISYINSTEKGWLVAVHDFAGNVSLLFVETNCTSGSNDISAGNNSIRASFRYYPNIFNGYGKSVDGSKHDPRDSFILNSFSLELFGTMTSCVGRGYKDLTIWSSLPQTIHHGSNELDTPQDLVDYNSVRISIHGITDLSPGEVMLDFKWIASGLVEAFPWLVVLTQSAAIVFRRSSTRIEWKPSVIFYYKDTVRLTNPLDEFPHLITALRCNITPSDEQNVTMKCNWHPESILASICTDKEGVQVALQSTVNSLYSWLSQWMNPDESKRPPWAEGRDRLSNAPLCNISGNYDTFLSELQMTLRPSQTTQERDQRPTKPNNGTHSHSREFMMAMFYGNSERDDSSRPATKTKSLPLPLTNLNENELCCLWAIGEILVDPPFPNRLDNFSQLCLFCVLLMRQLMSRLDSMSTPTGPLGAVLSYEGGRPTMVTAQSNSDPFGREKVKFDCIASAAILSALMSDSQVKLLDACRTSRGEKFNWESARAIGAPFWVRSEKQLTSLAEEIAQSIYKSTKSVMDCAIFYIAMRNKKKLIAIAATDRSDQGKKFLKFITDHDFTSEQGRNAAEKNAYSLLRKRKYTAAASFFLLAEPPMIKTALDVITSQLQDLSLAFFIARLMENASSSSSCAADGSLTIGGGFNLSSMGGGGGFAGSGNVIDGSGDREAEDETEKFDLWKPKLGRSARSVLLPNVAPGEEDLCFESAQLLWLGRFTESKLRLARVPTNSTLVDDLSFPLNFSESANAQTSVLDKANQIINFCSGPTLLKRLNPKKRVLWSSALLVSRALSRCGIEIPSMNILSQCADPTYKEEAAKSGVKVEKTRASNESSSTAPPQPRHSNDNAMSSSIFESFDAAPSKQKVAVPKPPRPEPTPSSIFDNFDAAPPKPMQSAPKPTQPDPLSSSIFDSYDEPPKPKHSAPKPPSDPMKSSIFDSFDAAPPRSNPSQPTQADAMTSSIFDSFDTGPPRSKPAVPKTSNINQVPLKESNAHPTTLKMDVDLVDEVAIEPVFNIPSCPTIWNEWRERQILVAAARTFIRELARLINCLEGEPQHIAINDFGKRDHPLIPAGAAEVLHKACQSEVLLNSIFESLSNLSALFGINGTSILQEVLELLSADRNPKRIVFSVIVHSLLGRGDLAEDIVRDAASFQTNSCEFFGFSNDTMIDITDTLYYTSSLWARRECSSVIWQLELCLWLSRGGMFELSTTALKETIVAIRVGFTTTAWGRCYHSLDTLVKAIPDCMMDFDAGKNLWRSMKIIATKESTIDGIDGVTSGGWEFLVDCRREEATEMLRDGKTGQFLIRPHPHDNGMFTLSFKTNLIPTEPTPASNPDQGDSGQNTPAVDSMKIVKRDDVVQHAIIRLTDSGFRCGSFGPFATLIKLLHAVSDSLPFDLRFRDPPTKGVIGMNGMQPSPNSILFRQMALHFKAEIFRVPNSDYSEATDIDARHRIEGSTIITEYVHGDDADDANPNNEAGLRRKFGLFAQLLYLTELRKQLCAVAAALADDPDVSAMPLDEGDDLHHDRFGGGFFRGDSFSVVSHEFDHEEALGIASRLVKPLLNWVHAREIEIVDELTPPITDAQLSNKDTPVAIKNLDDGSEVPSGILPVGDSMIRRMIQADSGVEFRTLRVGEAGNSVIVVLFGMQDAIKWLMRNVTSDNEADAKELLKVMERMRVIELVTSNDLSIPKSYAASHPSTESRYRFVDPWEVEALESRSGEKASAALGRGRYHALSVGLIASACEHVIRSAGGLYLLSLWSTLKGGISLTKALCSAHPSWERDAGGDLLMNKGYLMEPSPYENSIRHHLYGNDLFRRLGLPQRFLALLQVELLDLKNITSPSGSTALSAYALLRLKRQGSSAPLNHRARSLDSACTQVRKINKSSGQNAPASWGSYVRFRFPLPEDVNREGKSFDRDRELLFKGPPTCLQITVYEKKFMSEIELGGADVNLESLGSGGQIEEWVPLRAGKDGITWFARIRVSLRFELLCLTTPAPDPSGTVPNDELCPSVGLTKIRKLSQLGAHEDIKHGSKNSMSTPDLVGYFGLTSAMNFGSG